MTLYHTLSAWLRTQVHASVRTIQTDSTPIVKCTLLNPPSVWMVLIYKGIYLGYSFNNLHIGMIFATVTIKLVYVSIVHVPDVRFMPTGNKAFHSNQRATWGCIEEIRDHFIPPICLQLTMPQWWYGFPLSINTGFECLQYADNVSGKRVIKWNILMWVSFNKFSLDMSILNCQL